MFAEQWNFQLVFSSPKYSQANGFAEKGVSIAQTLLLKNVDLDYALLQYRVAPVPHVQLSPAQLFLGCRLQSTMPLHPQLLEPKLIDRQKVTQAKAAVTSASANHYNRTARPLPPLVPGALVSVKRTLADKQWNRGIVVAPASEPRSYMVKEESGALLRRNRRFLRPIRPPRRLVEEM